MGDRAKAQSTPLPPRSIGNTDKARWTTESPLSPEEEQKYRNLNMGRKDDTPLKSRLEEFFKLTKGAKPLQWRYILEQWFLFPLASSNVFRNEILDTPAWTGYLTPFMVFSPVQSAEFFKDHVDQEALLKVVLGIVGKLLEHQFNTKAGIGATLDAIFSVMDTEIGWTAPTVEFARKILVGLLGVMALQADRFKHNVSDVCWGNLFDVCGVLEDFMFFHPALIRKGAGGGKRKAGMHLDSKGCQDLPTVEKLVNLFGTLKPEDIHPGVYEAEVAKEAEALRERTMKEQDYWQKILIFFVNIRKYQEVEDARPAIKEITAAWKDLKRPSRCKVVPKKILKDSLYAMAEFMHIHRASDTPAGRSKLVRSGSVTPDSGGMHDVSRERSSSGGAADLTSPGGTVISRIRRSVSFKGFGAGSGPAPGTPKSASLMSLTETNENEDTASRKSGPRHSAPEKTEDEPVMTTIEGEYICPFGKPVQIPSK
eukprot:gb/GEZN01007000.1/.p1 GENE.gb/GEZN01007000.1/~~gb/GEZN01007000.1/.p1  ORF type:complete len:482 (-),score=70.07 gb/GEZN01007000.1/:37-1482(-)